MNHYGVYLEYETLGTFGRCQTRACPYPGFGIVVWDRWNGTVEQRTVCWSHFIIGGAEFSIEHQDADVLLCLPRRVARTKRTSGSHFRSTIPMVAASSVNEWNHTRLNLFLRQGYSYKASLAVIKQEAIAEGRLTHYSDPIYNTFTELRRSMIYTMCGEKVIQSLTVGFDLKPTCEDCLRMHQTKLRLLPETPLREVIATQSKSSEHQPSFEESVVDGSFALDDQLFANRRNWGERSGRSWSDPTKGVQRDKRLRVDRGGVNRKR